jgi:hypothetical protein
MVVGDQGAGDRRAYQVVVPDSGCQRQDAWGDTDAAAQDGHCAVTILR